MTVRASPTVMLQHFRAAVVNLSIDCCARVLVRLSWVSPTRKKLAPPRLASNWQRLCVISDVSVVDLVRNDLVTTALVCWGLCRHISFFLKDRRRHRVHVAVAFPKCEAHCCDEPMGTRDTHRVAVTRYCPCIGAVHVIHFAHQYLRTVEAAFPGDFADFLTARRVCVPFLLDPVAACPEPLWLGRRAAALVAAFLWGWTKVFGHG